MPLWIDNTGLQSAGRSLNGRAFGRIDVDGLLNLAVLIVFADKLIINGFEPENVAKRTRDIRDQLIFAGMPSDAIEVLDCSSEFYWEACRAAGVTCAQQLHWTFDPSEERVLGTHPEISREEQSQLLRLIDLATAITPPLSADDIRKEGSEKRAGVAIPYMLATVPELGAAIRLLVSERPNWDIAHTMWLDTHIRFFLNTSLAKQAGALYAPAIARARTIRERRRSLLEHLLNELDASLAPLTGGTVGFPAVVNVLLKRCKGDRMGLLDEAFALRMEATPLRKWLADLAVCGGMENPDSFLTSLSDIRQTVAESVAKLRLGPPSDGLDISITWGLPTANLSGTNLKRLMHQFRRRPQIAVLTEMAKFAVFEDTLGCYYDRLHAECRE